MPPIDSDRYKLTRALRTTLASDSTPHQDCLLFNDPGGLIEVEIHVTHRAARVPAQRVAYALAHPEDHVGQDEIVGTTCGQDLCVQPGHLVKVPSKSRRPRCTSGRVQGPPRDTREVEIGNDIREHLAATVQVEENGCHLFTQTNGNGGRHLLVPDRVNGGTTLMSVRRVAYVLAHPDEFVSGSEMIWNTCDSRGDNDTGKGVCINPEHLEKRPCRTDVSDHPVTGSGLHDRQDRSHDAQDRSERAA